MNHIELKSAEIFRGETNKTFEYNLPDKDINWCLLNVCGRFPTKGWALNKECKEMVFVIKGHGKLIFEDKTISFKKNDLLLVDKNTKFYWNAKAMFGVACTPAWYPKQHLTLPEITYNKIPETDKEQVLALIDVVIGGLEKKEYFIPYEQWELDSLFDENYAPLLGAYEGKKLVGMAQLYVKEDFMKEFKEVMGLSKYKVCELGGNLVLPEYRGLGITTKLQTMFIDTAKELGFDYIISMAHPDNVGSLKTLERIGLEFQKETTVANGHLRKVYLKKL